MKDLSKFIKGNSCYQLPGDDQAVHMIPVSGGVDSSALVILMHFMFPEVDFQLYFSDTCADMDGVYETLDELEAYLGKKIYRDVPELGLFELIAKWNNFLPSSLNRYCTRVLKIEPYERHLQQWRMQGREVYGYVGLRADEPNRFGLLSHDDGVHTELPFKAWGIVREDVFAILAETLGHSPSYYAYRTRSGCVGCWGMRRMEAVMTLDADPVGFQRSMAVEKLSLEDLLRAREFVSVPKEIGIGANWATFPLPAELDWRNKLFRQTTFPHLTFHDVGQQPKWTGNHPTNWNGFKSSRKSKGVSSQLSFLVDDDPMQRLWVGVEFRLNPNVGGTGVWWQQVVSFSNSRAGITKQLQGHFELRLRTAEVLGMDQQEVIEEVRYGVYLIEAPLSVLDPTPPGAGSFTWRRGESMEMVRRLTQFAKRSLHMEGFQQERREAMAKGQQDRVKAVLDEIQKVKEAYGKVVGMTYYIGSVPEVATEELDEEYVPCFACSL